MSSVYFELYPTLDIGHRRRIYTEVKAKVVAAVWGTELIQSLASLAVLHSNQRIYTYL